MQGLELELCTEDRIGLLSDITRIFRENSLCIKRAEISTKGGKVQDTFHVTDVTGNPVDPKIIDSIRRQIGQTKLQVKHNSFAAAKPPQETTTGFFLGNFFKVRSFQNFKLIRSYSQFVSVFLTSKSCTEISDMLKTQQVYMGRKTLYIGISLQSDNLILLLSGVDTTRWWRWFVYFVYILYSVNNVTWVILYKSYKFVQILQLNGEKEKENSCEYYYTFCISSTFKFCTLIIFHLFVHGRSNGSVKTVDIKAMHRTSSNEVITCVTISYHVVVSSHLRWLPGIRRLRQRYADVKRRD